MTKLILYPADLPQHFACTQSRGWLIKRSGVGVRGERLYTIEHWDKNGKRDKHIHFSSKFFLPFVDKLEEIMNKKLHLYREYGGTLYRICKQQDIPADDTRTYDKLQVTA